MYNGTSWTEVNNLNLARNGAAAAGTQTSALCLGGEGGSPDPKNETELWNGTSWTEVNNLNSKGKYRGGSGVDSTAALCFGGIGPDNSSDFANTEKWNGTNWTTVNSMVAARHKIAAAGTSSATVAFGGNNLEQLIQQLIQNLWNGSSVDRS